MTAAKRPQIENKPSFLLSKDENDQLFKLIGPRCKSMATAVVQVLYAESGRWSKRHCGTLCFIKDNNRRSYFLRVYCLDRQALIWEQELYTSFEYKSPRSYFHTFEGEDCRVGFNYADEAEAEFFLASLNEYLRVKTEKRAERRRQSQMNAPAQPKAPPVATNGSAANAYHRPTGIVANPITNSSSTSSITSKKSKDSKSKAKKLTKADIGLPSDFKHVSHVGWDPNQGFALENVDPHLLQFFAKAGVSESQLQDKATRDFIYDFIDRHGGTEAAIREISNQSSMFGGPGGGSAAVHAPPVPARNPPSTPQSVRIAPQAPPPPPPSRVVASPPSAPPAPPQRERAPPQPRPTPPYPAAPAPPAANIPPPPPMSAAPPPPPMPMSVSAPPPPPPPTAVPAAPSQPDPRNALMESIRSGSKLKPVAAQEVAASRPKPPVNDTRHDLLSEIRGGKELKPVEVNKNQPPPATDESLDGLAGALARALENRFNVIHSDSDESGQEDDEDDDWDE